MENKDTFIIVLIIILAILYFYAYKTEGFFADSMYCANYPLNSNCNCPADLSQQIVDGSFPMNYGQTSPYDYRCVNSSEPEPNTTLWQTPR